MCAQGAFDSHGVKFLSIQKDNDIIISSLIEPVIRLGWMFRVQVFERPFVDIGKGLKDSLEHVQLWLPNNHLLIDTLSSICFTPFKSVVIWVVAKVFPVLLVDVMLNGNTDLCRANSIENLDSLGKFFTRLMGKGPCFLLGCG